jgi:hypothetical protein
MEIFIFAVDPGLVEQGGQGIWDDRYYRFHRKRSTQGG